MTEEPHRSAVPMYLRRLSAACVFFAATLACSASLLAADEQQPLHKRIDAVVDASRIGGQTPVCSDAEFMRRVYLDLVGVIPTAAEAKAFLEDGAEDKRQKLIDRLLADPRFDRHMQITFDVMLMERRPAKYVTQPEWSQYLYTSFAANKPLDQLAREILAADGSDEKQRAAARFYLDREAEPNLVTRDVGRMFLGRDMQCAQCHDHPLIDDYFQSDYYGIFAFLNRGSLFTDPKKKVFYAEKAEGDLVDFKSVFTGEAGKAAPHLPGAPAIDEPKFAKDAEYVVKPAKDVRPVPKFSRRGRLAEELTSGKYRAFQRNMANRLWGHMLGRGIVEPYDVDHSANPPSQPELLELLTDELVAVKFDARAFLREIASSKTYQRAASLPDQAVPNVKELATRRDQLQAVYDRLAADAKVADEELRKLAEATPVDKDAADAAAAELAKLQATFNDAEKQAAEIAKSLEAAKQTMAAKAEAAKTVGELAAQAEQAAAKLAGDEVVTAAANQLAARSKQLSDELAAAEKTVSEQTAQAASTAEALSAAKDAFAKATAANSETVKKQQEFAAASEQLKSRRNAARQAMPGTLAQLEDVKALLAYSEAAAAPSAVDSIDADAAPDVDGAWQRLTQRWSQRFFVAEIEPLTPEQVALSVMQATGLLEEHRAAAEAAERAKLEKDKKTVADDELARLVETAVFAKAQGDINNFVNVLSQGSGPGATAYQSTVQEALFLTNGSQVSAWVKPKAGNLADRLMKLSEPAALAEELYLSVLTRQPREEELAAVTDYLAGRDNDRQTAIEEMIWGLLSSAEFRFNH